MFRKNSIPVWKQRGKLSHDVTGLAILQGRCVRHLGVMISNDLTFGEDNKGTVGSVKMIGWVFLVLRAFKTKEVRPVMTFQSSRSLPIGILLFANIT